MTNLCLEPAIMRRIRENAGGTAYGEQIIFKRNWPTSKEHFTGCIYRQPGLMSVNLKTTS
jgi:hypothetical protein